MHCKEASLYTSHNLYSALYINYSESLENPKAPNRVICYQVKEKLLEMLGLLEGSQSSWDYNEEQEKTI